MLGSRLEASNQCASNETAYSARMDELRDTISQMNLNELDIQPEDMFDEFCDPNKPVRVSFNDISAAAYRIKGGVDITPCVVSVN